MKNVGFIAIAVVAVAITSGKQAKAVTIADAAADWVSSDGTTAGSVVGGTAAGWSYLQSDAANGGSESALTAFDNTGDVGGPGFGGAVVNGNGRVLPAVQGDNANGGEYELFGDGFENNAGVVSTDLLVHANGANNFVIVRYTLTVSGQIDIDGSFRNLVGNSNNDSVDGYVYHNGTELFHAVGDAANDGLLLQATGTFDINGLSVTAGDTIDFVVDSNGSASADETALQATVSTIPEPNSVFLMMLGITVFGTLCVRRRRSC